MSRDLFRYASTMFSEVQGRDREDAVRHFFEHLNRAAKGRRSSAEDRYRVVRVRRLGFRWWSVSWRRRHA
jgi:hypothetical protein